MAPKVFPKDDWEKTQYVPTKFRGYVELVRPFTLFAPLIGGLSGALLALVYYGDLSAPYIATDGIPHLAWDVDIMILLWGVITLVFLNAASNTFNQITDYEIDKINKPYRPLPSKVVTKKEARIIAIALYAITIWRAALVNRYFFILVLILIAFTIFYSMEPIRLKKRLFISNISIAIPRGMLGFVSAWCIFGSIYDPVPWIIGSIMAVYLIGAMTTKDFTDAKGDAAFGCRTLPVVFGNKMAIYMSIPFFVIPFLIIPIAVYFDYLPEFALLLTLGFLAYGAIVAIMLLKLANVEDEHFENSPVWKHIYILLMCIQLGFGLLFVFKDFTL
jgi:geranylgeranylglycerol-phosphate geranylgeranyltransferase